LQGRPAGETPACSLVARRRKPPGCPAHQLAPRDKRAYDRKPWSDSVSIHQEFARFPWIAKRHTLVIDNMLAQKAVLTEFSAGAESMSAEPHRLLAKRACPGAFDRRSIALAAPHRGSSVLGADIGSEIDHPHGGAIKLQTRFVPSAHGDSRDGAAQTICGTDAGPPGKRTLPAAESPLWSAPIARNRMGADREGGIEAAAPS